jgi:type I restriction enzyme S subunit
MLRSTPASWRVVRLGQLFRERKEKVSDEDFQPLSVTKNGIVPQLETAAKTDAGDNRKAVYPDDFVINSRSDRKGSAGVSELKGSVSLISIVLEPKAIDPAFAHHLLRSYAFGEEFYRWGHGIVADLWTTRWSDMKNVRLALPDHHTQKAIAAFLDRETARIDQLIDKKQRLVELLDDHNNTAISALLRGTPCDQLTERSDAPWLGSYPSRWPLLKLSYSLVSSPCYGVLKPDASDSNDAVPLIRIKDVSKDGRVDVGNLVRISGELSAEFSRTVLSEGDLIVSVVGTIGRALVVNQAAAGANLSRALARLQTANTLDAEFLRLVIGTDWFTEYSNFMTRGTAQKVLNMDTLAAWRFPLPPVDEQRQIVQRAYSLPGNPEHARDLALQSIDRLKEYRSALITAAVTGQIDVETWRRGEGDRHLDRIEEEVAG